MSKELDPDKSYDIQIKGTNGFWKTVGTIHKRQFRKTIVGSKHIYKKTHSLGIDAKTFDNHVKKNCDSVLIFDEESSTLYTCTVTQFDLMKQYLHHKPYRAQVFMKIKYFTKINKTKSK